MVQNYVYLLRLDFARNASHILNFSGGLAVWWFCKQTNKHVCGKQTPHRAIKNDFLDRISCIFRANYQNAEETEI